MPSVGCAGCGGNIEDRYYLLTMGRQWHGRCLTCSECGQQLDDQLSCYVRDGSVYCRADYYRLFQCRQCPRCLLPIPADEWVLRAREHVFHTHCFACSVCNKRLTKGEQYGLKGDRVYCRDHLGRWDMETYSAVPRERISSTGPFPAVTSHRTKRVRTSFKHHQLRAMKSFFAANQNPDSKDLKQLSQKTGLNKRVLQVWFQNARAKYRRTFLRQDRCGHQQVDSDTCPSAGVLGLTDYYMTFPLTVEPVQSMVFDPDSFLKKEQDTELEGWSG